MKLKLIVFAFLCTSFSFGQTLLERQAEKTKEKIKQRAENRVEQQIDKGLDKTEQEIENSVKGENKKGKKEKTDAGMDQEGNNMPVQDQPSAEKSSKNSGTSSGSTSHKTNSKFDFEPGNQELYFDDFQRLNVGDFPAEFNTNASGEIVNIDGKQGKWLAMTKNGFFIPESIKELPENFTLEFDVALIGDPGNNYSGFGLNFTTNNDDLYKEVLFFEGSSIAYLHPGADLTSIQILPLNGVEIYNDIAMPQWSQNGERFAKISIWRQKGRLRLYVNEDKLVDSPRFFSENKPYKLAFFRRFFEDCEILMTNIRFAVAGEDNRSKLITEGRFVTTEIQFDVNSDAIKPESGTVLREIATVLQENPSVRVKIIGHTDSDGDAESNLILSQKRADAVKNALINFYGINTTRIEIEGKGESQPLNNNTNESEKASNRRVEFIKV